MNIIKILQNDDSNIMQRMQMINDRLTLFDHEALLEDFYSITGIHCNTFLLATEIIMNNLVKHDNARFCSFYQYISAKKANRFLTDVSMLNDSGDESELIQDFHFEITECILLRIAQSHAMRTTSGYNLLCNLVVIPDCTIMMQLCESFCTNAIFTLSPIETMPINLLFCFLVYPRCFRTDLYKTFRRQILFRIIRAAYDHKYKANYALYHFVKKLYIPFAYPSNFCYVDPLLSEPAEDAQIAILYGNQRFYFLIEDASLFEVLLDYQIDNAIDLTGQLPLRDDKSVPALYNLSVLTKDANLPYMCLIDMIEVCNFLGAKRKMHQCLSLLCAQQTMYSVVRTLRDLNRIDPLLLISDEFESYKNCLYQIVLKNRTPIYRMPRGYLDSIADYVVGLHENTEIAFYRRFELV